MDKKIGISLCGGGARGWGHIGVLWALEEFGISPQYVSGTSAGSIVAAMYASGKTPQEMLNLAKDTSILKVYTVGVKDIAFMPTSGITRLSYLKETLLQHLPPSDDFKDLKKQAFMAVSNLNKCDFEIISSGSISDAVVASSAIPIVFKPQKIGNNTYVDGGLINNLPVEPLKSICDLVIGVNINNHLYEADVDNAFEIGLRCFESILWTNTKSRLNQCDIKIEPIEVFEYGLFDFGKAEEIVDHAYKSTRQQMPEIRAKLKEMDFCLGEMSV